MRRAIWASVLGSLLAVGTAHAQAFPSRPVTVIVTAAPGGVTDVVARAIGQRLSQMWGQPVIIENKGGAGHILGAQAVARAVPDGHTLLVAEAATYVLNPSLYARDKLGYDVETDLAPITGLVRINQGIAASNALPVADIRGLIALAQQKPDRLTYGTAAIGSALHVNMLKFATMAGVKLQAVHYRGAAPALNDVMAGHIDLICVSLSLLVPPFSDHRLKILAVGSERRVAQLPDMPTVAESGVPGFAAAAWFGLATGGAVPRDIVMKINADVQTVLRDPAFQARFMAPQMFESMATTPDEFRQFMRSETANWAKIIKDQHLVIE